MDTKEKLAKLADMMDHKDVVRLQMEKLIEDATPQEVRIMVNDIRYEFGEQMDALQAQIDALQAEIKSDVLRLGGTVKSQYMMAVWNKGRVSWDTKALDTIGTMIPAILVARKEGDPSVTIRMTGG